MDDLLTDTTLPHVAELTCDVCRCLMLEPYTLQCGHSFCGGCLESWINTPTKTPTCPSCRVTLTTMPYFSFTIQQIANSIVAKFNSKSKTKITTNVKPNQREFNLERSFSSSNDEYDIVGDEDEGYLDTRSFNSQAPSDHTPLYANKSNYQVRVLMESELESKDQFEPFDILDETTDDIWNLVMQCVLNLGLNSFRRPRLVYTYPACPASIAEERHMMNALRWSDYQRGLVEAGKVGNDAFSEILGHDLRSAFEEFLALRRKHKDVFRRLPVKEEDYALLETSDFFINSVYKSRLRQWVQFYDGAMRRNFEHEDAMLEYSDGLSNEEGSLVEFDSE